MVEVRFHRRHTAVVAMYAALAIAATGVPVVATSFTSTAKTVTGDSTDLKVSDIDTSRLGTLTVIEPDAGAGVVAGVQYTIARIKDIDLGTEAGWNAAKALTDAAAKSAAKDNVQTLTVDDKGQVIFTNLPVGVYYVTEQTPSTVPEGYLPSKPFIVTLPVSRKDPKAWDYDFSIYAKGEPATDDKGESSTPSTPPPTTVTTTPSVPVVPPVTTTTTVTTPVTTTTTPTPDKPPTRTEKIRKRLATTGANVLGLIAIGVAMLIIGGLLVARRRRSDEDEG